MKKGTKQACSFRDSFDDLTKESGLSVYGLSTDSPKSNTSFRDKNTLPYTLLCDAKATLVGALGFKKSTGGATRGVFAVDKSGKVLLLEPGSPDGTVSAVKKLVDGGIGGAGASELSKKEEKVAAPEPASNGQTEEAEEEKKDIEKAVA
jgi:thioredoxin-dependent peroxiredoxin